MKTEQPKWVCVGLIGDVSPIEHGGALIFADATFKYAPELVVFVPLIDDKVSVERFVMENCRFNDVGEVTDSQDETRDVVWFAEKDRLKSVADYVGKHPAQFANHLTGQDMIDRAWAWWSLHSYYGIDELDGSEDLMTAKQAHKKFDRFINAVS